jgi:Spy/CpxP family protein refolding chaperone
MRDRVLAALLTLAVFATGFFAGLWAERHRPLPPPPGAFMGEFGARPGHTPRVGPPVNRAELSEQIDRLRPEMDLFRSRITEIYAQFDRDIDSILTPEQRDAYAKRFQAHRGFGPSPDVGTDDTPLSDEQINQLLQRPFRTLAFFVVIPMTLERMTNDLKLDDAQRDKVKDLLRVRREKFIELVDSAPPPSLMLSRLAPLAQRLGAPAKPAAAPAH